MMKFWLISISFHLLILLFALFSSSGQGGSAGGSKSGGSKPQSDFVAIKVMEDLDPQLANSKPPISSSELLTHTQQDIMQDDENALNLLEKKKIQKLEQKNLKKKDEEKKKLAEQKKEKIKDNKKTQIVKTDKNNIKKPNDKSNQKSNEKKNVETKHNSNETNTNSVEAKNNASENNSNIKTPPTTNGSGNAENDNSQGQDSRGNSKNEKNSGSGNGTGGNGVGNGSGSGNGNGNGNGSGNGSSNGTCDNTGVKNVQLQEAIGNIQQRIMQYWFLPEEFDENIEVLIELQLDTLGKILSYKLLNKKNTKEYIAVANSVLRTLNDPRVTPLPVGGNKKLTHIILKFCPKDLMN